MCEGKVKKVYRMNFFFDLLYFLSCLKGLKMMYSYCDEHDIPYKKCGKLIVATEEEELPRLDALWDRAIANGCTVNMVDSAGIKEIEPHCVGLRAIHSPLTGNLSFFLNLALHVRVRKYQTNLSRNY